MISFTSHSTQNRSFPRCISEMFFPANLLALVLKKLNLTQQKQTTQEQNTTPHHHNHFTALFRDHPGEPVPEENFWTLWCKGRLTEADTRTNQLGATPSRLTSAHLYHPPIFYRPDALPAAQPTVSKT